MKEYRAQGYRIVVEHKPQRTFKGFTRFVRLNGKDIFAFLDALKEQGVMKALEAMGQVWVCLSGNEGRADADCRCTICIEAQDEQHLPHFPGFETEYTLDAEESEWASILVSPEQDPGQMHRIGVYSLIGEIGYQMNFRVGFHLDNEHEWGQGNGMTFMMPVEPASK